jgi:hypothetical protein
MDVEWVSECVSVSVRVCECVCVSEADDLVKLGALPSSCTEVQHNPNTKTYKTQFGQWSQLHSPK